MKVATSVLPVHKSFSLLSGINQTLDPLIQTPRASQSPPQLRLGLQALQLELDLQQSVLQNTLEKLLSEALGQGWGESENQENSTSFDWSNSGIALRLRDHLGDDFETLALVFKRIEQDLTDLLQSLRALLGVYPGGQDVNDRARVRVLRSIRWRVKDKDSFHAKVKDMKATGKDLELFLSKISIFRAHVKRVKDIARIHQKTEQQDSTEDDIASIVSLETEVRHVPL